ncbi:hypothetical protein AXG93_2018s1440 [Marchantia polymorpha subsp. ruderalis]|uniref:Uncharacterized protein n=1 Tax=Marchantia polymorpha subsp. ruderalis TaxID=1480154 RepID=A0A176WCY7_MARPO|nr:hypothetical protein AXG93_2018s1440 [Marchantia polymorpha subsp. ruderalis]
MRQSAAAAAAAAAQGRRGTTSEGRDEIGTVERELRFKNRIVRIARKEPKRGRTSRSELRGLRRIPRLHVSARPHLALALRLAAWNCGGAAVRAVMREGCTALMGSSVHGANGYGFLDDASFQHQDMPKIQCLDQHMVFYPSSPGPTPSMSMSRDQRCKYAKPESELVIHVLDDRADEAEVCHARDLAPWPSDEADRARGPDSDYETPSPALPVEPSPSSSAMASPAVSRSHSHSHSPDIKRNTPEPRSVLDLAISPRASARSSVANFGFPNGVLDVHDSFLNDFHRVDSGHLLALVEEDSSRWGDPPTNSGDESLSQQNSQLWMDSFIEDFGVSSTPTSLPGLETEGEEARTNSFDTPTSTPSEGHKSSTSDQDQSEEEGNEDATAEEGSPPPQQANSEPPTRKPHREVGLELVNLLLACAEAVATKSLSLVNPLFAQLGELASPEGTSMQRVAAYYTEGLATRCSRLWPQIYQPLPYNLDLSEEDSLSAFHILNHVCPYTKFSHFTANEIILQAFEQCDRVHVIDFDIKQGLQWPALFQSLAARPGGPPSHVRVTGVGDCKEDVQDTGDRLAEFAEALDLQFEFHAVIDKLEDVRLWMLHVKEKEVVAVNCLLQLHRTLHDAESGIKDMLGLIMSTKPKVVAVVEQEASHNGPFFEGRSPRFLESLQYYAAVFDSLDLNMPSDSMARMKVEQFFAREIRNIIACEGPERVERHERIEKWREHMTQARFESVPLSKRAKSQAKLLLEMFACKSYTLSEDAGALTLGWRSRPLFTASAWAPTKLSS